MPILFFGTPKDELIDERTLLNVNSGDQVDGGAGDDTFILVTGKLFVVSGLGNDLVDATASSTGAVLLYANSPSGIVFDDTKGTVQDGWGGIDTVKGNVTWVFGSDFSDRIKLNTGQIYALAGDDIIEAGNNMYIVPGQGNDKITGTQLTLVYLDAPAKISGNLQESWMNDGWGTKDQVSGVSKLYLPQVGSEIVGSTAKEIFDAALGGGHTISGGGGEDEFIAKGLSSDYSLSKEGANYVFTNKKTSERLSLSNLTVYFSDRIIDLRAPISEAHHFDFDKPILFDATKIYQRFGSGANVSLINLSVLDLNRDGKDEIVAHYWQMQNVMGTKTDAKVANELLILGLENGKIADITNQVLAPGQEPKLSGISRQSRIADLNGDGRPDIAWSMNQEDGRDGDSNNSALTSILLSDPNTGRYSVHQVGTENWFHGVAAASALGNYPGLVVGAGFRKVPSGFEIGKQGITVTENLPNIGSGTLLHLDWLDDPVTGKRYILGDVESYVSKGHLGLLEWSPNKAWAINTQFADNRDAKYREVTWISWQLSQGTVRTYEYKGFQAVSGAFIEGAVWHPTPTSDPLVILSFATAILTDASKTVVREGVDTVNAIFLEFYNVTRQAIQKVDIKVLDEEIYITNNYSEVMDFNRDGYEDLIVYPYRKGGQPIVYLNDTHGGLYKANLTNVIPSAPITANDSYSTKILDANNDGIWDFIFWPLGYRDTQASEPMSLRMFLGLQNIGTGPDFVDASTYGAPGFNEKYYLDTYPDVAKLVASGRYLNGLDHYLKVGKSTGYLSFAPDVWVHGSNSNDVIQLREGGERAFANSGDDQIIGAAGNDTISGGAGNDSIDGGSDSDTAIFSGKLANYTVTKNSGANGPTYLIKDSTGVDGNDTVSNVEILKFADKTINLTIQAQAKAAVPADVTQLCELYVAFFNRVPDADGLSYWISQKTSGKTINQIADSFYGAGILFSDLTGFTASMSNADFINVIYRNVLGRKDGADPDGLAYWSNELASGKATRGSLVSTILYSAHTFKGDASYGFVADLLDNKLAVAKTFAIDWGLNFNSSEESITNGMAIAAAVTPTSVQAAINLIGVNFDLGGF